MPSTRHLLPAAALAASVALLPAPALAAPSTGHTVTTVYVAGDTAASDGIQGQVIPIDAATGTMGTPAGVGQDTVALAASPNGRIVYAVDHGSNDVTAVRTSTGQVAGLIRTFDAPDTIAVPPDGTTAWILSDNSVMPLDTATGRPGPRISLPLPGGYPAAIAVSPDGSEAWVASEAGTVTPVSAATDTAGTPVNAGIGPLAGLAITPDGSTLYAVGAGNDLGTVRDEVAPIPVVTLTPGTPIPVAAGELWGAEMAPDGKTLYVGTGGNEGDLVTPVTVATNTARPAFSAPGVDAMAVSGDSATLWLGSRDRFHPGVTPVNTATGVEGAQITTPKVWEMALVPGGRTLWTADAQDGSVTPVNTVSGAVGATIQTDLSPAAVIVVRHWVG